MRGADQGAWQETAEGARTGSTPGLETGSRRRREISREGLVEGILRGERAMLAQAITLVESSREADRELAGQIVEDCLPHSGNALRVGITGVPGAGKSTLIEALGTYLTGECGQTVAVLAIDPSSSITGGSILGDKTRMPLLAACERAFIRPSPSRGSHGGVAQRTREAMLLCEAAGYRNILVETVGVGQAEAAVREMVDCFVLMLLAGAGDELQGLKRGVMEMADVVAINKADGNNAAAAERARRDAEHALQFFPGPASGWKARAITCSAQNGRGIASLWSVVLEHAAVSRANGWFDANRRQQRRHWMREALEDGLRRHFQAQPLVGSRMEALEADVLAGRMTPFRAARVLLDLYGGATVCGRSTTL